MATQPSKEIVIKELWQDYYKVRRLLDNASHPVRVKALRNLLMILQYKINEEEKLWAVQLQEARRLPTNY